MLEIKTEQKIFLSQASCAYKPLDKVVAFIHKEMIANVCGAKVKSIRDDLNLWRYDNLIPFKRDVNVYNAYWTWYQLVKTGGPWDHKRKILDGYGKWVCDFVPNIIYQYDIWSNLHYGYVGLAAGFSEWDLLTGAGVAQLMARTAPDGYWDRRFQQLGDADFLSAFDDPHDQTAIKIGFQLWKDHKENLTAQHILDAVRRESSKLSTAICALDCKAVECCSDKEQLIIVIDPGHGDIFKKYLDSGAVWENPVKGEKDIYEKDLALNVSKCLKLALVQTKIAPAVFLTREKDLDDKVRPRLRWRTDIAKEKKAHIFISIHLNSVEDASTSGHAVYSHPKDKSDQGHKLAASISAAYNIIAPEANSVRKADHEVTRNLIGTSVKAAVLVEIGFISNSRDRAVIAAFCAPIAIQISNGVVDYINNNLADMVSKKRA